MFAVTIDQRSSRSAGDRVPGLLKLLAEVCAGTPPIAGFDRTVGDEVEGLFDDAAGVVAAVRTALVMGDWHIGLGIGSVESTGRNVREARGSAFVAAREAVLAPPPAPRNPHRVLKTFGWIVLAGGAATAAYIIWRRSQPVEDPWAEEYWADSAEDDEDVDEA